MLEKLKLAKNLEDVANLLGYKSSALSYIIYKIPEESKYKKFDIHKRSGGLRNISAPDIKLKLLQRRLANVLYQCLDDIKDNEPTKRPLSHGFAKDLSIVTNASIHKRRRYVLNLDLKDFFPSINFGRVRGVLIKDKRFQLEEKVATIIAQIACHDNALPQGSPCSPVLSNIVAHILDVRLLKFAIQHKCTYSRYADDITFSTSKGDFPVEVALPVSGGAGQWELGSALISVIAKSGFVANEAKTRMQIRGSRQMATGLLVNEKVNVRPEYYRNARAMCWSLFNKGIYYRHIHADLAGGLVGEPAIKKDTVDLAHLQGVLDHIFRIRDASDRRENSKKKKAPTATRALYRKLLFYKHFVALGAPLLIPEGKTDSIYLKAAIQKLPAFHPMLGEIVDGKLKANIKLMKFSPIIHDVLQLGTGAGDLKYFLQNYKREIDSYRHSPMLFPIIILIDNDKGANDIFPVLKNYGITTISHKASDNFYRVYKNLYVVKTPEGPSGKEMTCIEDLFDQSVIDTLVGGKKFDPDKQHGEGGKYGKTIFAEKVVRPNINTIDFVKFAKLLDRIICVLGDYVANPSSKM